MRNRRVLKGFVVLAATLLLWGDAAPEAAAGIFGRRKKCSSQKCCRPKCCQPSCCAPRCGGCNPCCCQPKEFTCAGPYVVCTEYKWYDNGTYCFYDATRRDCWPSMDPACCNWTPTYVRHWDYHDYCPHVPSAGPCPLICENGECLEMGNPSFRSRRDPVLAQSVDKNYEPAKDEVGKNVRVKKREKYVSFVSPSGRDVKYATVFFFEQVDGDRKACVGFEIENPGEETDHVARTWRLEGHRYVCEFDLDGTRCTVITTAR